jgi:hypothetical protein
MPAWKGANEKESPSDGCGSAPDRVLALVTVIRVGAGTATTFLKGANRHQLLAAASVGRASPTLF